MNIMIKKKKGYYNRKIKLIACMILSFFIYVLSNGEWAIPAFAWIYHPICKCNRNGYLGMYGGCCVAGHIKAAALSMLGEIKKEVSGHSYVCCCHDVSGVCCLSHISNFGRIVGCLWAIALWIWDNRYRLIEVKKYVLIYGAVMGTVFLYGISMYQFGDNPEKSVRTAGVTEPVSRLLNEDQDVYAVFYTDTFTDENMANTKHKLALVTDRLFIKSVQKAQAGAKIVFWSELNVSKDTL